MKSFFGFSLIEVLISLLLFTIILLAFNVMQLTAWRMNQSAYFLTTATLQIQAMKERLRVLDKEQDLSDLVARWNVENQTVLPQGNGSVLGRYPDYSIELCWTNKRKCLYAKNSRVNSS